VKLQIFTALPAQPFENGRIYRIKTAEPKGKDDGNFQYNGIELLSGRFF